LYDVRAAGCELGEAPTRNGIRVLTYFVAMRKKWPNRLERSHRQNKEERYERSRFEKITQTVPTREVRKNKI
jgi:hypothetical protein